MGGAYFVLEDIKQKQFTIGGRQISGSYKRKTEGNPGIIFDWIGQNGQNSNSSTAGKLKRKEPRIKATRIRFPPDFFSAM